MCVCVHHLFVHVQCCNCLYRRTNGERNCYSSTTWSGESVKVGKVMCVRGKEREGWSVGGRGREGGREEGSRVAGRGREGGREREGGRVGGRGRVGGWEGEGGKWLCITVSLCIAYRSKDCVRMRRAKREVSAGGPYWPSLGRVTILGREVVIVCSLVV